MSKEKEDNESNDIFAGLDSFVMKENTEAGDITLEEEEETDLEEEQEEEEQEEKPKKAAKKIAKTEEFEIEDESEEEESDNSEGTDEDEVKGLYKAVAKQFVNDGVFTVDVDDFDGSPESFKGLMINELEEWKKTYLEALPAVVKDLAENWEEGVDLEKLIKVKSEQIRYSQIKEEALADSKELQKQVVRDFLKSTTKFSDQRIAREIERLEDTDELKQESFEALKEIKAIKLEEEEEIKQQEKEAIKQAQLADKKRLEDLQKTIEGTNEFVPGVKLSNAEKRDLFRFMTVPIGESETGEPVSQILAHRSKDPVGFDIKLAYFVKAGFFDGDFNKITKKVTTKVLSKFEEQVEAESKKVKGGKSVIHKADDDGEDLLSAFGKFAKKKR